jgi:hypothetical protein
VIFPLTIAFPKAALSLHFAHSNLTFFFSMQTIGLIRAPLLFDGSQAPPVTHHADDTHVYLENMACDGPEAQRRRWIAVA